MLSFTIADGAVPSNLDRGYVMRKVLRRAVRYGKRLGFDAPFLAKLFPTLLASMSDYSELATSQSKICEVLTLEEEQFFRTLKRGGNILTNILETSKHISGEDAFKLKDTYGFPIEEILLIAKDNHLDVHLEAYELLEAEAKERSRTAQTKHAQVAEENTFKDFKTHFVGYDTLTTHGSIIGIIVDGALTDRIEAGEHGMLILDTTSFYGEGGGQVGDTGTISHASAHFSVSKATKPFPGVIAHQGVLSSGILLKGEPVQATVERTHRQRTSQNHTATHLLHWALEQVLGPHIRQAGSLVEPDRIRFDFSHHKPLTHDEIRSVEERVNEKIRQNAAVSTYTTAYDSVKQDAHIKQFFGDKYGAEVRVVAIAPFSKELCGGTHVHSLQEIGLFRITGESSIAAGSRRIEAVTGSDAETFMYTREDLLNRLCQTLSTNTTKVHETLSSLLDEQKKQKEELRHLRRLQTNLVKETLLKAPEHIGSTTLILKEVQLPKEECNTLANDLAGRLESFVLLIAHKDQDRCQLLLRISPDLVAKGIKANELLAEIAKPVGGGGGGKADSAQAGGKDPSRLSESLTLAKTLISSKL